MKFTKFTAVAVAVSTLTGSALAADLPSRRAPFLAPPPPVFTWSGFYVGLNAGGTFSNSNNVSVLTSPVFNAGVAGAPAVAAAIDASTTAFGGLGNGAGAILGAQAGYNWQFATPFVLGIEADIQGVVQSSRRFAFTGIAPIAGFAAFQNSSVNITKRLDYLGTVRGRLGYAITPSFMLYVTGGLAYGGIKTQTNALNISTGVTAVTPAGAAFGVSTAKVGYTIGGGGEWMFMPNWSLKAEYLYYDLRSVNSARALVTGAPAGTPFTIDSIQTRVRYDGHIARLGVNYHFWAPVGPVVARY